MSVPGPSAGPTPMPVDESVPVMGSFPGFPGHGPGQGPQPADSSALKAEVDRMNNRNLTEQGKELGRYVRGLYDSGLKMYDKDMFREVEDAVALDPRPETVQIRSMNGQYRRKNVPEEGYDPKWLPMGEYEMERWQITARFKIIQKLIYNAEDRNLDYDDEDRSHARTRKPFIDDDERALASRAFTLGRRVERFLDTSIHVLRAAWEETKHNWINSRTHKQLLENLSTIQCPPNANKLICFGLGSLDGSDEEVLQELARCDDLPIRAAMTQHLAAQTMASVFGAQIGRPPLRIMAQDPAYAPAQVQFLTEVGIEVVPGIGALGFTYVDDDSIVFSCSPDVPVKQIVADIAKPAGMIWNVVKPAHLALDHWTIHKAFGQEMIVGPWSTDDDSSRVRDLITEYNKANFPADTERFGRLEIYMRKH